MPVGTFSSSHRIRRKQTTKKVPVKVDKPGETKNDKTLQLAVEQFLDFLDEHTSGYSKEPQNKT